MCEVVLCARLRRKEPWSRFTLLRRPAFSLSTLHRETCTFAPAERQINKCTPMNTRGQEGWLRTCSGAQFPRGTIAQSLEPYKCKGKKDFIECALCECAAMVCVIYIIHICVCMCVCLLAYLSWHSFLVFNSSCTKKSWKVRSERTPQTHRRATRASTERNKARRIPFGVRA